MSKEQLDFREFLSSLEPAGKKAFAAQCGTTYNYLLQVAHGHRRASSKLSRKIREKSKNVVRLASLRADIWPDESSANNQHQ